MKPITPCLAFATILLPGLVLAQQARPACALMEAVDLKPLLGAGHAAPAPYADTGCIVKSKTAGRLVMFSIAEKPNAELRKDLAAHRKTLGSAEYAAVSTVATAPEFGPEAFSAREKGEKSAAEIHALKGTRALSATLNWSNGAITEPVFKQLRELTASALAKLP
ncbi:MAG: hypothetical protein V4864_11875 [Pseudomonadota bacterium]